MTSTWRWSGGNAEPTISQGRRVFLGVAIRRSPGTASFRSDLTVCQDLQLVAYGCIRQSEGERGWLAWGQDRFGDLDGTGKIIGDFVEVSNQVVRRASLVVMEWAEPS